MECLFISGANRGLGLALTETYLTKGYRVLAGSHEKRSADLDGLSASFPGKLDYFQLELGSDESVRSVARSVSESTDRLDLLINNAAILGETETRIPDIVDFDRILKVMDINSVGPLRLSNALFPLLMLGGRRLIVNISSEAGSIEACGRTGWYGYCMSKAALNMQTQLLHNQLLPLGGQAMAIHPGWVRTYMQGHKDEAADLTATESATRVAEVVSRHMEYLSDQAAFVDYKGIRWPW